MPAIDEKRPNGAEEARSCLDEDFFLPGPFGGYSDRLEGVTSPWAVPWAEIVPDAGKPARTEKENGNKGGGKDGGGGGNDGGRFATAPTDIALSNDLVEENSADSTLIGTFFNDDPDRRDRHSYELLDDAGGRFAIGGRDSLVVANGSLLDYEARTSHDIVVQVTDKAGNTFAETMTISLADVAEMTNSAPTDIVVDGGSVAEDAANGTEVARLAAVDPDPGETFAFTMTASAGGRFALDGDRIVVADAAQIDYETATSHAVTVQVADSAGNTYAETVSITVTDVAENTGGNEEDTTASGAFSDQPYYVQALLESSNDLPRNIWPDADPSDAATTVTFAILTDIPSYYNPSAMPYTDYTTGETPFVALTDQQQTVIRQLLAEMEELIDVDFVEVGSAAEANVTFGQFLMDSTVGGFAYNPSDTGAVGSKAGDVWLNSQYGNKPVTSEDGGADYGRYIIAHELGHAMGLEHPSGLSAAEDNVNRTVMSYDYYDHSSAFPVDFMTYDIAALQYAYGDAATTRAEDTVYSFTTGQRLIDTIWDTAGFDTMDASAVTSDVVIDLNPGGYSSIGDSERKTSTGENKPMIDNIAIAYGTGIEAANGGSGNDRLIGNALDNVLRGNAGSDIFEFGEGWGADIVLDFEDGTDTIDLSPTGLSWADLSFGGGASGAVVSAGGNSIEFAGLDTALLDEADFAFGLV